MMRWHLSLLSQKPFARLGCPMGGEGLGRSLVPRVPRILQEPLPGPRLLPAPQPRQHCWARQGWGHEAFTEGDPEPSCCGTGPGEQVRDPGSRMRPLCAGAAGDSLCLGGVRGTGTPWERGCGCWGPAQAPSPTAAPVPVLRPRPGSAAVTAQGCAQRVLGPALTRVSAVRGRDPAQAGQRGGGRPGRRAVQAAV